MPDDLALLGGDESTSAPEAPATPESSASPETPETPIGTSETPETPVAPEAQTPEQPQTPETPEQPEEELEASLTPDEILSIKAFNEKITKNANLKAAIDADPGLKNLFYSTARLAQQGQEFKEIFQTPDAARTALELANRHIEFENAFSGGNPANALDALYGLTATRDAQGNIDFEAANPAYQAALTSYREDNLWRSLTELAVERQDADLLDAVAIVATRIGDRIESPSTYAKPGSGAQKNEPQQLAPDVQNRLNRLDELERQQQENTRAEGQRYQTDVQNGIADSVEKSTKQYLDNLIKNNSQIALTDFVKSVVVEKAIKDIYELAKNDVSYRNHMNFLFKSSKVKDEELKNKLVAEATKYAKARLPKLISKHISEASKGAVVAQQQRTQKQTKQQERTEVQSTAGVSTPSRQDPAERVREFIKQNKRKPTDREILDF